MYESEINVYNLKNWLFSTVGFLQKWLAQSHTSSRIGVYQFIPFSEKKRRYLSHSCLNRIPLWIRLATLQAKLYRNAEAHGGQDVPPSTMCLRQTLQHSTSPHYNSRKKVFLMREGVAYIYPLPPPPTRIFLEGAGSFGVPSRFVWYICTARSNWLDV